MDQKLSSIVVNAIDSLPESLSTRSDEYNENLSSIISRDEVRKFARGGQLSESKIGLIAVVVAIMQERIIRERGERIRDAKDENARAYAFLFGRMKNVWASTILSRKDRSKAEAATEEKRRCGRSLLRIGLPGVMWFPSQGRSLFVHLRFFQGLTLTIRARQRRTRRWLLLFKARLALWKFNWQGVHRRILH